MACTGSAASLHPLVGGRLTEAARRHAIPSCESARKIPRIGESAGPGDLGDLRHAAVVYQFQTRGFQALGLE